MSFSFIKIYFAYKKWAGVFQMIMIRKIPYTQKSDKSLKNHVREDIDDRI